MSEDSVCVRHERRRLRAFELFEVVAWGSALIAVIFLRSRGMQMDLRTFDYILSPLWRFFPKALVAGVLAQLLYCRIMNKDWRGYLRSIRSWSWTLVWVRLWAASMVMTYGYFWIKVTIPLVRSKIWDDFFWRLDILLHLGFSPSIFSVELLSGTPILGFLDLWYGLWIPSVFYVMAFYAASIDEPLRRSFIFSCVLLWTLGSWLYFSLPALGPCYSFPEIWKDLEGSMPGATASQATLWENYQRILAGRTSILKSFNPTRGVAAMPSLHVAAHWLFALWARRSAPCFFMPFVLATFLTWIASIATGWHFAVDGYVGMLLAWLCFRLAIYSEPSMRRRSADIGGQTEREPSEIEATATENS